MLLAPAEELFDLLLGSIRLVLVLNSSLAEDFLMPVQPPLDAVIKVDLMREKIR